MSRLRWIRLLVLACAPCAAHPALAQEADERRVHVGVLLDGTGADPRADVVLVIRGERIAEIRASDGPPRPGELDLRDHFVLPGLIDVHAHLTLAPEPELDYGELSGAALGILGVVHAERTLRAGFTTVRDPGGPHYADVALRDAIRAGRVPGPRLFVSGPVLTITGGHGAVGNGAPPEVRIESGAVAVVDGADEVRREIRRHQKHGVDFIKVIATGGIFTVGTEPGAAAFTPAELAAAVDEARKRGQKVAAHAHGLEGIRNAVLAGVHSIEHGSFLDEATARLMVERGTFLVPDVLADEWSLTEGARRAAGSPEAEEFLAKARAVSADFRASVRLAHRAGVAIAFGTDAGVYPHGENARQLALYVALGMTPHEALATATRNAAALLGASADVGTLEVGKYADLVAVPRDPLADVRALESIPFVMQGGRIVEDARSDGPDAASPRAPAGSR
jgi:imidazolonepropionase-like amidohydrolase